jgi:hypothetical protein
VKIAPRIVLPILRKNWIRGIQEGQKHQVNSAEGWKHNRQKDEDYN